MEDDISAMVWRTMEGGSDSDEDSDDGMIVTHTVEKGSLADENLEREVKIGSRDADSYDTERTSHASTKWSHARGTDADIERSYAVDERARGTNGVMETIHVTEGPYATGADMRAQVTASLTQAITSELLQAHVREQMYEAGGSADGVLPQNRKRRTSAWMHSEELPSDEEFFAEDPDPGTMDLSNPVLAAFVARAQEAVDALGPQGMRMLQDMTLEGPLVEEVTPGYLRDFFRAPRPECGERECREGIHCVFNLIEHRAPTPALAARANERFVGRELLLPSQVATNATDGLGSLPPAAGWCVLCWRYNNTRNCFKAMMNRRRIDNVLKHHYVRAGVTNGYNLDKCIPIMQQGHENGVVLYQVMFSMADYSYVVTDAGDLVVVESDTLYHSENFARAVPGQTQGTTHNDF